MARRLAVLPQGQQPCGPHGSGADGLGHGRGSCLGETRRGEKGLRMKLRKIIFWLHLTAGVVAGTVILVMSVTGVLLAFERQIVAFAERDTLTVTPPASDAPRLSLDILVAKARETVPAGAALGYHLVGRPHGGHHG